MLSYFRSFIVVFIVIISGSWCQRTENIVVEIGTSFSFDCKPDESVYFGRQLNDWSEIQENNNNNNNQYSYLNLKFNYLNAQNILRITSDSAQSYHSGYYGCRKSTWTTAAMNRVYQVTLADVESFYWSYVCHGPAGSCIRSDDVKDDTLSTLEVSDRTNVDLFCCASVSGYKKVDIKMNKIGDIRGKINVKRRQELDKSWVVCAIQHTSLKRTSSQQKLTCELITDDRSYSSFSSKIIMKNAIPVDPDLDPPFVFTPPPRDDDGVSYFEPEKPSSNTERKTGKKNAIIIGFIIGGLLIFGVLFVLVFFLFRKKKALKNSQTNNSTTYSKVNTTEKPNKPDEKLAQEEESLYLQPVPLYQNIPVVLRL